MNNMSKVFSIIVTYNALRNNWIIKCLESLQNSSVKSEIIIIDNNSYDKTIEVVEKNFPNVSCIKNQKNIGFGQANNIGIKYALNHGADYVLLLNQDAVLEKNALERMLSQSDGISLVSPVHLNGDGTSIDALFKYSLNTIETLYDDIFIEGTLKNKYFSGEVCAACWIIPKRVVEVIGGFNPIFFHYGEDNNYFHRLIYHNIRTIIVPNAKMFHDRKVYGDIIAFNKDKVKRDIMLIACNINMNSKERMCAYVKCIVHYLFIDFPKKEYKLGTFLMEILRMAFKYNVVLKSRKIEKQKNLNWL